jgi:hypothetical protein
VDGPEGNQVPFVVRSPLLCTIFVGVNWAFLIDLYLLLTIVVFPSLSLTALLWGEVGVAAAVLLRAAMLEVRVTSDGVGLRNMFRIYRFGWHEAITFEYGTDIHVLGRPYGNLLALRWRNGRILKALGTVSFQESRLEDIERGLSRVVQSRRRFEMGRRR